ncbi:MAG TPA: 30S ribosomal protein S1 [Bacteroidia bacterium]|nr:30S ribosomal protein S1 [Bacteroidia bacterium]
MIINEETSQETAQNLPEENNTVPSEQDSAPPPSQYAFNWETVSKTGSEYSPEERERFENLYTQSLSTIAANQIVDGTIVAITEKDVVVNIGFKSDGLVPLAEFRHIPELKVGDKIEVFVESQEDINGQLILSHRRAREHQSWARVNKALETQEVIQGFVKCRTKGGLIVDVFGIEAFLPGSQIDVKPIRDYDVFVNKTMEFKVVKINNEFKNVVVSHKILIEEEMEQQKIEIISKLEKGQVLEGTVKNITSYGVFMDLGGVDGLLHITDISWGRIAHPQEVLALDQKINVVILDFDDQKKRIALGLKQLTPHPWSTLDENLKVGDRVKGKVVVLTDYGAFVEIQQGVEGLIHVSEMSWSQHMRSPQDFLKVGQEIEAMVLTLDREERKMSLGIKQLTPDPWLNIMEKYPVGSRHKTKVRNVQNFGVFVELEEGIEGLVHVSDLTWTKKVKHPSEFTKQGDEMEVVVLDVDLEHRRMSLGHKQLEENPWDVFATIFLPDSIHEGTVMKVNDKGAIIALQYGIEGFAPLKHAVKEDGKTMLKADEKAQFRVMEFSKENQRILLSHSHLHEEKMVAEREEDSKRRKQESRQDNRQEKQERREDAQVYKKLKDSIEKSTLGDLDVLSNLKSEMEETEKVKPVPKEKKKKEKEKEKEVSAEASPIEDISSGEAAPVGDSSSDEATPVEDSPSSGEAASAPPEEEKNESTD